jgi:hypothetical protein
MDNTWQRRQEGAECMHQFECLVLVECDISNLKESGGQRKLLYQVPRKSWAHLFSVWVQSSYNVISMPFCLCWGWVAFHGTEAISSLLGWETTPLTPLSFIRGRMMAVCVMGRSWELNEPKYAKCYWHAMKLLVAISYYCLVVINFVI